MVRYLTEKEIVAINYYQIKQFSPSEDFGLKDPKALKVCVNQPKQVVFEKILYPTLYNKAAILFEMLINKHCFYNGNKRTAVMALYTFLKLNGVHLKSSNEAIADYAVSVAIKRGNERLTNENIAHWIEIHSVSL